MRTYQHAHGTLGAMDLLDITCPRCAKEAQVRFYGPCDVCRNELSSVRNETQDLGEVDYEPKMNVIPNQVATKE